MNSMSRQYTECLAKGGGALLKDPLVLESSGRLSEFMTMYINETEFDHRHCKLRMRKSQSELDMRCPRDLKGIFLRCMRQTSP